MHGQGILTFKDGNKYEGFFVMDKREGHGKYIWTDGRIYDGEWKNGKQHGKGLYIKYGEQRYGEWDNGKRIRWI